MRQRAPLALIFLLADPLLASVRLPTLLSFRPLRTPRPDVVLITIDTLRADALGFAGNRRVQTPVLDRLAAGGKYFPNAHAHNVITLPSHANILTGLLPFQHGVRDNVGFRLAASIPTVATVLKSAGYATGAFVGGYPLNSQFGLGQGFEVYDCRTTSGGGMDHFVFAERRGDEVVAAALAWWRQARGRPRFLWVHLFDPHSPYAPPEPFASRYADKLYLGEVSAVDSFLAPLLEPFLNGRQPAPFVVLTADHGESLGEHGELTHGLFAYEATLKVPLVIWGPGVVPGRGVRAARHVDIFPTVLQAAGVPAPAASPGRAYPGRSLLLPPPPNPPDSYFEALSAAFNRGWAPLRGMLRLGRKFISLPLPEVYELAQDPLERKNLYARDHVAARSALASLPRESAWPPRRIDMPQEIAARLQSLGYLTGSVHVRTRYGSDDDPKSLVGLDHKMHQVIELYSQGKFDEAARLARVVVAQRPAMPLGHWLLAQSLLAGDRTQEALHAMESARRRGAATTTLLRQLGLTLARVGRTAEALMVLRPVAADGAPQSLNALALALSQAGRQREAAAVARRSLAADPNNVKAREQLGLIELRQGHWNEAREQLQRAIEANPRLPLAWNNLGVALFQLQQHQAAFQAWQRAIDLDPSLWDTLWNLGTKAAELGFHQQARTALERFVAAAPRERYAGELRQARRFLDQLRRGAGGRREPLSGTGTVGGGT